MTQQTWKINGQVYTHGQLLELKKKGLDPRKDRIIMSSLTTREEVKEEVAPVPKKPKAPKKEVKPAPKTIIVTQKMLNDNPDMVEEGLKVGEEIEVSNEPMEEGEENALANCPNVPTQELPTNFMQLKKMAAEKGMEVTKDTKKEDILKFLSQK